MESIVEFIPPPQGSVENKLQALIFDSWFDSYLGVVALVRVQEGCLRMNEKIFLMETKQEYSVVQLGKFCPQKHRRENFTSRRGWFFIAGYLLSFIIKVIFCYLTNLDRIGRIPFFFAFFLSCKMF